MACCSCFDQSVDRRRAASCSALTMWCRRRCAVFNYCKFGNNGDCQLCMWWPKIDSVGSKGARKTLFLLQEYAVKNGSNHTGMIPVSVAQPVPVYRYGCSAGMGTLTACRPFITGTAQLVRNLKALFPLRHLLSPSRTLHPPNLLPPHVQVKSNLRHNNPKSLPPTKQYQP